MKRLIVFVFALALLLSACANLATDDASAALSANMERRIQRDWFRTIPDRGRFNRNSVRIDYYFGTYNGSVALMISDDYTNFTQAIWDQEVAGFVFRYGDGQFISVWNNRNFYTLPQAYELGLLTSQNLRDIHYHFNHRSVALAWQTIPAWQAHAIMAQTESFILLDVRTEAEFHAQRINGARLIPYNEITGRAGELPDPNAVILIYCQSGRRSALAAAALAELGFTNIYDFGGIIDWPYEIITGGTQQ